MALVEENRRASGWSNPVQGVRRDEQKEGEAASSPEEFSQTSQADATILAQ